MANQQFVLSGRVEVDAKQAVASLVETKTAADDVAGAQKRLADGAGEAAPKIDQAGESTKQFGAQLAKLRTFLDDVSPTQSRLNGYLDTAKAALDAGALSAEDYARAEKKVSEALKEGTEATGNASVSKQILGHVVRSTTDSFAAGLPVSMIFGEQIGRLAEAAEYAGGTFGKFGAVMSGPWGIAIQLGVSLLAGLVGGMLEAADTAKELAASEKEIAELFDKTTGRIKEQTTAIQRLAAARANSDDKEKQAKDLNSRNEDLFWLVNTELARRSGYGGERGLSPQEREGLGTANVAFRAGGSPDALAAKINSLADANPTLAALAKAATTAAAGLDKTAESMEKFDARARQLAGTASAADLKLLGYTQTINTSALDAQAKLQSATTGVDRAEAQLTLTRLKADEAVQARLITSAQYTQTIADAETAVKKARDAEEAHKQSIRDGAKETREAERAAKAYQKTIDALYATVAKTASKLGDFQDTNVAELIKKSDEAGAKNRQDTGIAASVKAAEQGLDGTFSIENGHAVGQAIGDGFDRQARQVAEAIGDIIGGAAGKTAQGLAGLIQGAQSGDFTGLGGRSGGLLTLAGALAGKPGSAKPGTAQADFSAGFSGEINKTFSKLTDKLGGIFGKGGTFPTDAGKAFAGASEGAMVAGLGKAFGLKTSTLGGEIGGAIGSLIPVVGPLLGSLIGSIGGGLLKTTKSGSATVSSSGGSINVGSATGNSASYEKAASAMGNSVGDAVQAIADQLGGDIGSFSVSIGKRKKKFTVDGSGQGRTKGVASFDTEEEAQQAALADAIRDGGVSGVSPKVQAVIQQYADNVNKAVAEALKVKNLEDLIANDANPFASAFKNFEQTAKQRIDVATKYGFDLVEIEKINGEQRSKLLQQTLDQATASVKSTLDELRFGDMAEGSFDQKRTAILAERDRLAGLAQAGDQDALDKLATISQQLLSLDKDGVGTTALYASDRSQTLALLDGLVKQTEDRINAASAGARGATDQTAAQLTDANASLDDLVTLQQQTLAAIQGLGGVVVTSGSNAAAAYVRTAAQ